jgi:ribosomal protein S12 methylthiotransferase accessory factor YcaO
MNRAILEAVQSRACYLAGARDDMFRRGFLFMRQNDQGPDIRFLQSLPEEPPDLERFPVSSFRND